MAIALSGDRTRLSPIDFGARIATASTVPAVDSAPATCMIEDGLDFNSAVTRFEVNILSRALDDAKGNKTAAAERLGIKRTTLIMKMRALENAGYLRQVA